MKLAVVPLALATLFSLSSAAPSASAARLPLEQRDIQAGRPDPAPKGYEQYTSPLVVPSPNLTGSGGWDAALVKAQKFVSLLTKEELVNMTTGAGTNGRCVGNTGAVTRLGFPGLCLQDGPLGVRMTDYASAFPAQINAATTWDKDLVRRRAVALGNEFRGKGANVALTPMMNMGRVAAGGRNWEGFGGDPFLTGVCAAETIHGVQSTGVIACAKHYVGNEQEHYRGGSGATASSSNIDDRTMHEIYAWPFAESVRAGVGSVMSSYQRINQTHASENSKTINGILKGELAFNGFVVSDWAATSSGVNSALAGLDMNMPGFIAYGNQSQDNPVLSNVSYWGAALLTAINNGSVPLTRVQDMVTRTMAAYYKMGQDASNYPAVNFGYLLQDTVVNGVRVNEHVNVQGRHAELIREIGAASTVLLKNVNKTLPLVAKSIRRVGVFGSDAGPNFDGANSCSDRGCDQGTLAQGWGSGSVNYPHLIDPLSAIQSYFSQNNPSTVVEAVLNDFNYVAATTVARQSDQCVVFVNSMSGEGYITVDTNEGDRNNLTLWHEGDALIKNVTSQCLNTVVVVHAVGPVTLEAWVNNPNVTAILWAGLPGEESGNAIVDVLFGKVNPSGRLPYTIAKERKDYPADVLYVSNDTIPQIDYTEKLLIDYRWFDAKNITPRYDFGYGLSYTSFSYASLTIDSLASSMPHHQKRTHDEWMEPSSMAPTTPGGPSPLYEQVVEIAFAIKNEGDVAGHEVSQVYLGFPESAGEPPKVLRGFERTYLESGQSAPVLVHLNRKALSIWDVVKQEWVIPEGEFKIYVGKSSRQIELTRSFWM